MNRFQNNRQNFNNYFKSNWRNNNNNFTPKSFNHYQQRPQYNNNNYQRQNYSQQRNFPQQNLQQNFPKPEPIDIDKSGQTKRNNNIEQTNAVNFPLLAPESVYFYNQ